MDANKKFGRVSAAGLTGLLLALCGCGGVSMGGGGTTNPPPPPDAGIQSINHIVFMAQENRSFDTYFGQLPAYWQANGIAGQAIDAIPAGASNPGYQGAPPITAFHIATECFENLSPSWNESHLDWNLESPTSPTPTMDGYVFNAAHFAAVNNLFDTTGSRAMGYYDGSDLNYYYFMASNFATSDRWFSPTMDRTQINRLYFFAATSKGYAYPPGSFPEDQGPVDAPTIFDALQQAGISWKIYTSDTSGTTEAPVTYLTQFKAYAPPNALPANVVPVSEYFTDLENGTLPQVAMIEGGYNSGRDEHPNNNVQTGAAYVSTLINGLMGSSSWKDSVFILTYDEAGGLYDHVPPQPAVSPDGIAPIDLQPTDICTTTSGPTCDFTYTGFRLPLLVVSPFTKKNFVSHTVADYTAILKLIEARFNVPALTQRDAAQMDMTEFFDFVNIPWATPPTPPAQATNGVCDFQHLQ
jgi:phospholipase C